MCSSKDRLKNQKESHILEKIICKTYLIKDLFRAHKVFNNISNNYILNGQKLKTSIYFIEDLPKSNKHIENIQCR